uniref:Putative pab-dependent polya-specific ribonuclease subunit pan3 isoform x2 n=1 Tax=Anopheles darlingi TaxID=43151 RepID=A0A2M4DP62_ANODA
MWNDFALSVVASLLRSVPAPTATFVVVVAYRNETRGPNQDCRTLDPTKIIVTGKRIRYSCVGISDIATFDPNQQNPLTVVNHRQQEDLTALGKLILALACRSLQSVQRDQCCCPRNTIYFPSNDCEV